MSKLAGRWLKVLVDDSVPTARDISTGVESVDIDDSVGELDVTGFSDGAENSIPGMPTGNIEMTCHFDTTATTGAYTVLKSILGAASGHTVTIQQGENAAPTTGNPEWEGEYWLQSLKFSSDPKGKPSLTASFKVYGTTAPAWGTVSG